MGGWHSLGSKTIPQRLTWLFLNLVSFALWCLWRWLTQWLLTTEAQAMEEMTPWHTGRSLRRTEKRSLFLLEPLTYCAPGENLGEVGKGQGVDDSCRPLSQGQRQQMCALRMEECPAF